MPSKTTKCNSSNPRVLNSTSYYKTYGTCCYDRRLNPSFHSKVLPIYRVQQRKAPITTNTQSDTESSEQGSGQEQQEDSLESEDCESAY
jgi:hypothetical protein